MGSDDLLSSEEVKLFLSGLKQNTDIDFTGYSLSSSGRRLNRIRKEYGLFSYDTLLEKIISQPLLRLDFVERFTVNVTEMFRDPTFFRSLSVYIDEYLLSVQEDRKLKIWHPGCSSGEEVLSLAIMMHLKNKLERIQFLGSDINEKVLERATRRLIRTRLLSDYEKSFHQATFETNLSQYFEEVNKEESRLRQDIPLDARFAVNNLIDLAWPGKGPFDVIICRNVMIYFTAELQNQVFSFFIDKLKVGGLLALGHKESIVFCKEAWRMDTLDQDSRIFRKRE